MNIPCPDKDREIVKSWLSKIRKKYSDDWKLAVNKTIHEDGIAPQDIHPEVIKQLKRKQP